MNCQTFTYATHKVPLKCDVYSSSPDYCSSSSSTTTPVFLFFHAGGLVGWARDCVPPWLVQVCVERKWPLISASYRFLPQAGAQGLLEDVAAAYEFAQRLGQKEGGEGDRRPVIVGGASAGFFCATLVAHHLEPPPLALLSITGIPTFRHPFFNSSTLTTPVPFTKAQVQRYLDDGEGAVCAGESGKNDAHEMIFHPDSLVLTAESGGVVAKKKPGYLRPQAPSENEEVGGGDDVPRGCLYDYFLYENAFPAMLESVDPGFEWATDPQSPKLAKWPTTILIHGDADPDVDVDVSVRTARSLGPEKARLFLAEGQPHLFEGAHFLKDEGAAMDVVRSAIRALDEAVAVAQALS